MNHVEGRAEVAKVWDARNGDYKASAIAMRQSRACLWKRMAAAEQGGEEKLGQSIR